MKTMDTLMRAVRFMKKLVAGQASSELEDDDVTVDAVTFYKCNSCLKDIPNGADRYHCEECDSSYDLCPTCYHTEAFDPDTGRRSAKQHIEAFGNHHTFILETRPPQIILAKVHQKTLQKTFLNMFKYYAHRKCLGVRDNDKGCYVWTRFCDLQEKVFSIAAGLNAITSTAKSMNPGMVAICGISSAEWYTAQIACSLLGKPTVPVLTTIDKSLLEFILNQTEAETAFCTRANCGKFEAVFKQNRSLKLSTLIVMDAKSSDDLQPSSGCEELRILSWSAVLELGSSQKPLDFSSTEPPAHAIYALMYTSGSTGVPKGCIFSNALYNFSLAKVKPTWLRTGGSEVWFSFQPPAHSTDHRMVLGTLVNGGRVGFYRGDLQYIFDDIREVQPSIVACTPRFWTMLYNQYQKQVMAALLRAREKERQKQQQQQQGEHQQLEHTEEHQQQSGSCSERIPNLAADRSQQDTQSQIPSRDTEVSAVGSSSQSQINQSHEPSLPQEEQAAIPPLFSPNTVTNFSPSGPIADHLANEELAHQELSRGLQRQLSGGEAVEEEEWEDDVCEEDVRRVVMERFSTILGGRVCVLVTGGAATGQAVIKFMRDTFNCMVSDGYGATEVGAITQDGRIAPSADVKLVDVPEMGYLTSDDPPRGEICVKTPSMICGYYRNEAETKEKFVDGYFRTGDIGMRDLSNGNVKIIDRKKNFFKLSQGEFVAPERLESMVVESSAYITQVFIYGESEEDSVVAVVVPERDMLMSWWQEKGQADDVAATNSISSDDEKYQYVCGTHDVNQFLIDEVKWLAESAELPKWEIPCRILVEPQQFTSENGLLTETAKPCRHKLQVRYREQLRQLYADYNAEQQRLLSDQVQNLITGIAGQSSGESNLTLSQRGVDSLAAVKLSAMLRDVLDIDLPAALLVSMPAESIVQHVQAVKVPGESRAEAMSLRTAKQQSAQTIDWKAECTLDPSIRPEWDLTDLQPISMQGSVSVLLTGAAGFLGAHILRRLLMVLPNCKVTCIIRQGASSKAIAAEKCRDSLLQRLTLLQPSLSIEDSQRIHVVVGNLGQPLLGILQDEYEALCQGVDLIIHNGAEVNSAKSYQALYSVNVGSTLELLRLACRGKPKRLHFVSSVGVFGSQPTDPMFAEVDTVPKYRLQYLSGYSQTKYVSEELLREAAVQRHCPLSLSRPGLVGADSVTGDSNHRDWLYWLLRGVVELGLSPLGAGCDDRLVDVVNVDYVAAAIVHAATNMSEGTSAGGLRVLHLVPDNRTEGLTWSVIVEYLKRAGYELTNCDYSTFRQRVQDASYGGHPTASSLLLLLPESGGLPRAHRYSSEASCSALAAHGFEMKPLSWTEEYFHKYLLRLVTDGVFPASKAD